MHARGFTLALGLVAASTLLATAEAPSPFAFLAPSLTLSRSDLRALEAGAAISSTLDAGRGEVAVFVGGAVGTGGDEFAAAVRDIETLRKGPRRIVRRLSQPPVAGDFRDLRLEEGELEDVLDCEPGSCGLKLSSAEIGRLQQAARAAGDGWREAVQAGFRAAILQRVRLYLDGGLAALAPYDDHRDPVSLAETFSVLRQRAPFLRNAPAIVARLDASPAGPPPGPDSFIYWTQDLVRSRPVVTVTHVMIFGRPATPVRPAPDVVVVSRQIAATHYLNGSLALTVLVSGEGRRYMGYLNRSSVDGLSGVLGGLKRAIVERRLRSEAKEMLDAIRARLDARGSTR
jgi:hypothetical protein